MNIGIEGAQVARTDASAGGRISLPAALLMLVAVLAVPQAGVGAEAVATMGGNKLGADEVKRIVDDRPQLRGQLASSDDALDRLVRDALIRRALLDEAQSQGWDKRPEVARRAEEAREQVILNAYLNSIAQLPPGYPGEDEIRTFYENNRAHLTVPQRYHLAQIFIKRPQTQAAGNTETAAARAAELARRAHANAADFDGLAKAESEDERSKDKGGDIGWYVEGSIVPEVRAVLPTLKIGDVSEAIASANGWHIVKLIESKPRSAATLEEARPSVINMLRSQKTGELERAHIDALLKRSPIAVDRAALSKVRSELK